MDIVGAQPESPLQFTDAEETFFSNGQARADSAEPSYVGEPPTQAPIDKVAARLKRAATRTLQRSKSLPMARSLSLTGLRTLAVCGGFGVLALVAVAGLRSGHDVRLPAASLPAQVATLPEGTAVAAPAPALAAPAPKQVATAPAPAPAARAVSPAPTISTRPTATTHVAHKSRAIAAKKVAAAHHHHQTKAPVKLAMAGKGKSAKGAKTTKSSRHANKSRNTAQRTRG